MSNQPTDAVAVLREAWTKYDNSSFDAYDLMDVLRKHLPDLLDELEQLRGIVSNAGDLGIDERTVLKLAWTWRGDAWLFLVDGKVIDDLQFNSALGALAWLRSDAGKAAVARAKGGQS